MKWSDEVVTDAFRVQLAADLRVQRDWCAAFRFQMFRLRSLAVSRDLAESGAKIFFLYCHHRLSFGFSDSSLRGRSQSISPPQQQTDRLFVRITRSPPCRRGEPEQPRRPTSMQIPPKPLRPRSRQHQLPQRRRLWKPKMSPLSRLNQQHPRPRRRESREQQDTNRC